MLALICVLTILGLAPQDLGHLASPTTFRIRLPRGLKPETVTIQYGLYGRGLLVAGIPTSAGVYEYLLKLDERSPEIGKASSLKLLIHCPGFRMVTAAFDFTKLGAPFEFSPVLVRLPSSPWRGVLVDSARRPVPGRTVLLRYDLMEAMPYFGYIDGMVPSLNIGSTSTDAQGRFTFEAPDFGSDPFFQAYRKTQGRFELSLEGARVHPDELSPASFRTQSAYPDVAVVMRTLRGTLRGRLKEDFLMAHALPADLTGLVGSVDSRPFSIRLNARSRAGRVIYNARLKPDGSFQAELPPGTYDLHLSVLGPGFVLKRDIPVRSDVVVKEGHTTALDE